MRLILKFKNEILLALIIGLLYFLLRLIYLERLPIFTDEAIYIRWAQIALQDSSWRFISLTDGKQPMFIWFAMIFIKFIHDPLLAGRLVSVFSGFFTLVGLFFLSYELFKSKTVSYLASILYVFYPFAEVYDRMALYDSMVGAFSVWALYFSVLLVKKIRLDIAYTLGFVIGAGVLTKTSNFFSIYLLPFTLLLFDFKKKNVSRRFFRWFLLAVVSVAIGYGLYNILRLSPLFQMITTKNALFVYTFSEWKTHPFNFFLGNLNGLFSWLSEYLKVPYMILILVSLIIPKKDYREKLLLFLYFLIPFLGLALFGRIIFPRFIYFMSLFLLPLAGLGLNYIIQRILSYSRGKNRVPISRLMVPLTVFVFIWYPALVSFQFAYDPVNAQIAKADSSQYVNSWAAGWGVKESVKFFQQQSKYGPIFIGTEGTFGLMPETMEIYLIKNKKITIKGYWPIDIFPKELIEKAKKMPTYIIYYQRDHTVLPSNLPLKLLFQIEQGNNNSFYRVYQVVPQ